jgi:hypothetical protein
VRCLPALCKKASGNDAGSAAHAPVRAILIRRDFASRVRPIRLCTLEKWRLGRSMVPRRELFDLRASSLFYQPDAGCSRLRNVWL